MKKQALLVCIYVHRNDTQVDFFVTNTGVRDQFRCCWGFVGVGGGGGAKVSCPYISSNASPKIKLFCLNIALFFYSKMPPAPYAYNITIWSIKK